MLRDFDGQRVWAHSHTMQINRREFLKTTAVATAATVLSPALGRAAHPPRSIKKAIMYATIGLKGTVLEKFQLVKAAGFVGVEPMSDLDQAEVLRALEATGLKAASVCGALHWKKPLSDPDPAIRAEGLEGLKQTLRKAKAYGATSVLLVPGIVFKTVTYDECFQRSVAEIRKVVPLAEELGVKIAIENVWNNFITKPEQAVEYLDAINSPMVGWHFDIGNALRSSPPEHWIAILGKRIVKMHFKEYSATKLFKVKFLEGDNNWPAIMQAVDATGYNAWAITEQPGEQTKDLANMQEFIGRLDKVLTA